MFPSLRCRVAAGTGLCTGDTAWLRNTAWLLTDPSMPLGSIVRSACILMLALYSEFALHCRQQESTHLVAPTEPRSQWLASRPRTPAIALTLRGPGSLG